jgi:glycine/D-amino acid oxidase-like deaminating enzyme
LFPLPAAKLTRRYGAEQAAAMTRALAGTVDEVGRVASAEGIDCHYAKGGTITLARSPAQLRRARAAGHELLDAAAASAICGASGVLGGTHSPDCAAIHPARLVRGLASAVERLGVTVHEGTIVLGIAKGSVTTDRGVVRADVVVRALEGYTPTLAGHRRALAPVYSLMLATEPLPAADWERIGLARRETFSDERRMIIYGQRTADDRLAFGGRGAPYHFGSRVSPGFDRVPPVFEALRATLREMFGISPAIAHRWGGPLAIPRDWMPSVGLRDGFGWGGGYVGDGVAAANLAGRTLADLILGRQTERTGLPWVGHRSRRWEPEPVRWLGINAALRATAMLDRLDR